MALESFSYITSLNSSNPNGATDPKREGDDHIRGVKTTLLNSFPNINAAVTKTPAEINDLAQKTNPILNGAVSGTAFLNDDTMATATDTTLASSDSIKKYIDAQIASINLLKQKVLQIGDWDMTTATGTPFVDVAHGLTLSTIRAINVSIINDNSLIITNLFHYVQLVPDPAQANYVTIDSTNVRVYRETSGLFDNSGYNLTPFNRGWIVIDYA